MTASQPVAQAFVGDQQAEQDEAATEEQDIEHGELLRRHKRA